MNAWLLTVSPIVGLIVNAGIQIAVAHRAQRVGSSIAAGAIGGFVATTVLTLRLVFDGSGADGRPELVVSILTYAALAFCFWTFLNLNITSLRIRMLRELLGAGDGLTRTDLLHRYSTTEFLRRRLERLESGSQLRHTEGRWFLNARTYLYLGQTLNLARAIILPRQREE